MNAETNISVDLLFSTLNSGRFALPLSHSHAQEVIAHALGASSWNAVAQTSSAPSLKKMAERLRKAINDEGLRVPIARETVGFLVRGIVAADTRGNGAAPANGRFPYHIDVARVLDAAALAIDTKHHPDYAFAAAVDDVAPASEVAEQLYAIARNVAKPENRTVVNALIEAGIPKLIAEQLHWNGYMADYESYAYNLRACANYVRHRITH